MPGSETIFRLHLNGGPKDDMYIEHWLSTLQVASTRHGLPTMLEEHSAPMMIPYRTGEYRLRLDGNGHPVPHNLQGVVEADWQGWRD